HGPASDKRRLATISSACRAGSLSSSLLPQSARGILKTCERPVKNNVAKDFTVTGATPTDVYYELGGFISSGGGLIPVAFLKNNYVSDPGYISGAYDRATLGVGAYPTSWIAVHKIAIDPGTGNPYIGILDGSNFTIASGNEFWGTDEIEFNGILGDYAQMPATTTSGTLQIPSINITPEPGTLALLAGGVLALLGRRRRPAARF
ncbi:MAG: PEP-CTERM sorting domain-containing protein, partial [Phycisphaerae bacterium]